jgi:hypothetical protein
MTLTSFSPHTNEFDHFSKEAISIHTKQMAGAVGKAVVNFLGENDLTNLIESINALSTN